MSETPDTDGATADKPDGRVSARSSGWRTCIAGFAISAGAGIGAGVGAIFGQPGSGVAVGAAIGVAVGAGLAKRARSGC